MPAPAVGQVLRKFFEGREYLVRVEVDGQFRLDATHSANHGNVYPSLTAVAKAINGGRTVNGWTFFGLTNPNPVRRNRDGVARDAADVPVMVCGGAKGKCTYIGCYEPADCKHGFCYQHCTHNHHLHGHDSRRYPRNDDLHIGVEIEVKYRNGNDYRRGLPLEGHADGSLGSYGIEYKILGKATNIATLASEMVEELWKRGARVDRKCGLHVHIDVRQITRSRCDEMVDWMRRTQETWYGLVPPSRRNNIYVKRIARAGDNDHYTWAHRTSYNTVEVRIHGSTLNPFKISGWLTALTHLQAKANDAAYQFPNTGDGERDFWALFADCPAEGVEYLTTRKNNNGVVRDLAFRSIEE